MSLELGLSAEKLNETEAMFQVRLTAAKKSEAKNFDIDKIVDGYNTARGKFDACHLALATNAPRNLPGWYPEEKTLLKMQAYVRDMKIYLVLAIIADTYQRTEYCERDTQWWLSKFSSVSNIVVDVGAAIIIAGEDYLNDMIASIHSAVDSGEAGATTEHPQFINETSEHWGVEEAVSYWGITAIAVSAFFSKARAIAQGKAVEFAAKLALLASVIGEGKIVLHECQNNLRLWTKTAEFLKRQGLLTKLEYKQFRKNCEALGGASEAVKAAKRAVRELYQTTPDSSTLRTIVREDDEGAVPVATIDVVTTQEERPEDVNLGVDVEVDETRKCGEPSVNLVLTFPDLLDMHDRLTFAREFVAEAVKEINEQVRGSVRSDYYQALQVIEHQLEIVVEIFKRLEAVPDDFNMESKMKKIFRALGVFGAETTAMVIGILERYEEEDLGKPNNTMKIVSLSFFAAGAILSGTGTAIHNNEMERLKLGREIERLKAMKEKTVRDLAGVRDLLRSHQVWAGAEDDARAEAHESHLKQLAIARKGSVFGLDLRRMKKKVKRAPAERVLYCIGGQCRLVDPGTEMQDGATSSNMVRFEAASLHATAAQRVYFDEAREYSQAHGNSMVGLTYSALEERVSQSNIAERDSNSRNRPRPLSPKRSVSQMRKAALRTLENRGVVLTSDCYINPGRPPSWRSSVSLEVLSGDYSDNEEDGEYAVTMSRSQTGSRTAGESSSSMTDHSHQSVEKASRKTAGFMDEDSEAKDSMEGEREVHMLSRLPFERTTTDALQVMLDLGGVVTAGEHHEVDDDGISGRKEELQRQIIDIEMELNQTTGSLGELKDKMTAGEKYINTIQAQLGPARARLVAAEDNLGVLEEDLEPVVDVEIKEAAVTQRDTALKQMTLLENTLQSQEAELQEVSKGYDVKQKLSAELHVQLEKIRDEAAQLEAEMERHREVELFEAREEAAREEHKDQMRIEEKRRARNEDATLHNRPNRRGLREEKSNENIPRSIELANLGRPQRNIPTAFSFEGRSLTGKKTMLTKKAQKDASHEIRRRVLQHQFSLKAGRRKEKEYDQYRFLQTDSSSSGSDTMSGEETDGEYMRYADMELSESDERDEDFVSTTSRNESKLDVEEDPEP